MLRFWRTHRSSTLSNASSVNRGDERALCVFVRFATVHMDCDGCEKRVRKAMSRLQGVSSVEIDMERQKATVTGRTGRAEEFWLWPYDGEYYPFVIQYLAYEATYRYYRRGYNDPMIGSYPCHAFTHIVGDDALAVFHEDNVHACAVM
ncbi:hypothetical protein PVAP13_1KG450130 [Panicum virgatum]|uniref:HMA domain-containing protein n=1 Tax=Panicum virgatum TaxID=38727 RepID=A0A8T0XN67_PANVG|nr:hypothetical protein PVAP13_1KG450130 [Panicum virgatum]